MTASYHLLLPLPNGRTGPNSGRLTVFVVPRLQATGDLTDWNTDWRNWPRVCDGTIGGAGTPLRFDVAINGTVAVANQDLGPGQWTSPTPSAAVWDAVFGTAVGADPIPVRRFSPVIRTDIDLHPTYDPILLNDVMEDFHQELTETHLSPPTADQLKSLGSYDVVEQSDQTVAYRDHIEPTTPFEDIDLDGESTLVETDFHQAVAYLQAHPELLRNLGLAIDLDVTIPAVAFGSFDISVNSNYNRPDGTAVPIEVTVTDDFWPKDGPGTWPSIGDGSHTVTQFDLGSAVFGFGSTERGVTESPADEPVEVAPLTEAGLAVARKGPDLLDEMSDIWEAQAEFEDDILDWFQGPQTSPIPVPGLLLVSGRRYDVWDDDAADWFSLWDREVPGGYGFPRSPALSLVPEQDEGWMTYTASTESATKTTGPVAPRPGEDQPLGPTSESTTLRVSPLLFRWKGWSLAADPPGRGFSGVAGPVDRAANSVAVDEDTGDEMLVQTVVDYEVPDGVLPRLRYTHEYKFRARTVDYAGNSRELAANTENPTNEETKLLQFGRQDPIGAPTIVRRENKPVPGWGDVPLTMVILSELEQNDATVEPTSRIVFPARTTQYRCELHGFPAPDGLPTSQNIFDGLVARTAASIEDHTAESPGTGELIIDAPGTWSTDIDYLVEPAQNGYAFIGLPDTTGPALVPLGRTWPMSQTTSIELVAGPEQTVVNTASANAVVTAQLPKGVTRQVAVASTMAADLLEHWRGWQQMSPATRTALQQQILDGEHWLFTSPLPFTIIHAVRRPLVIPAILGTPTANRAVGSTLTGVSGTFRMDVKSTDKLVVRGQWTDPIDTVGAPGGVVDRTTGKWLFEQRENYREIDGVAIRAGAVELGDTKRHEALLSVEALGRYARYFTERAVISFPSGTATVELEQEGIASMNVTVRGVGGPATAGEDYVIDGPAGTITRTLRSSIPVGTQVVVDFIRLPINRLHDEDGAADFPITFPNSGVPDPIALIETLPAFTRTPFGSGDGPIGIEHLGQTIRVWLGRPWFTTGVGELLGVKTGQTELARDAMSPNGVNRSLNVGDFPSATSTSGDVAGHEVVFDEERELWFSDIAISGDVGYRPFMKLALCRFQPVSVAGAEIGPVVVTEPIRLGANRESSIERIGDQVEVVVVGEELGNEVTAFFQEADTDIADVDLRWDDLGDPVVLTPAADPAGVRWTATLDLPVTDRAVRLIIEDAELLTRQRATGPAEVRSVSFHEVLDVPDAWTSSPGATTSTTIPGAPGAVASLDARAGNERVLLEWSAPDDNGNPLVEYRIEQQNDIGGWEDLAVVSATRTQHVVRGLTNGVAVTFRVRAESAGGVGPWSPTATVTPDVQVPGRVRRVVALSGGGLVRVRWRRAATRGAPLTGYRLERRTASTPWGDALVLGPEENTATISGVAAGTELLIRVRAESAVGPGAWSRPAEVTVQAGGTVPDQVHGVTATGSDGALTVEWLAAGDGGSRLIRYDLQVAEDGGGFGATRRIDADQLVTTIEGLTNGVRHAVRVRAVNIIGAGDWSTAAVGVPTP